MDGHPPASVNMYWRRFRVDSIPIDNPVLFDSWLRDRWTEKDMLLSIYNRTGRFPADNGIHKGADGKVYRGAGYVESEVKSVRWYEFLKIFAPVGLFAMVLYMFYGAIPKEVVPSPDKQVWGSTVTTMQKGAAEKSRRTKIALLNDPSGKVQKDIFTAATQKTASSLPDTFNNKVKAENLTAVTRKSPSLNPDKSSTKAKAHEFASTARKTAISIPSKSSVKTNADSSTSISRNTTLSLPNTASSNAKADNSAPTTRKTANSIISKSNIKNNAGTSLKATQKTATSLPSNATSKSKADKFVTPIKKTPPKLGIPGAGAGKSKEEKPALGALAIRKKPVHDATQETKSGAYKSSMPINHKAITKNKEVKTSSSNRPSKEPATQSSTKATRKMLEPKQATKKVAPKLHPPKPQPHPNQKRLEPRPDKDSALKTPRSQNIQPKGAVQRPSNVAVSKSNPIQSQKR